MCETPVSKILNLTDKITKQKNIIQNLKENKQKCLTQYFDSIFITRFHEEKQLLPNRLVGTIIVNNIYKKTIRELVTEKENEYDEIIEDEEEILKLQFMQITDWYVIKREMKHFF